MAHSESEDRGSEFLQSREMWDNFKHGLAGAAAAALSVLGLMAVFLL